MPQIPATITGNLTGDVHLRELPGGARVARFRVAASRSYRDQKDDWQSTDHLFITIDCWNQLADNVRTSLGKGLPIIAVGILVTNEWIDKDTNEAKQQILLRATHVGVDMNRYVVSSMKPDSGVIVPGMTAPETSAPAADQVLAAAEGAEHSDPNGPVQAGGSGPEDAPYAEPSGGASGGGNEDRGKELAGVGAGTGEAAAGTGDDDDVPF